MNLTFLMALRGKAALNWAFKVWDVVAAAPLTDQLAAYDKAHAVRARKLDTLINVVMAIDARTKQHDVGVVIERLAAIEKRLIDIENHIQKAESL